MSSLSRQANSVAASANPDGYGIGGEFIALVAQFAIPALIRCWSNNNADPVSMNSAEKSAKLKQLAEDNWRPGAHAYDRRLIRQMRQQTREAAVRANQHLTPPQLDLMSAAILDRARLADEAEIAECLTEVATIDLSTFPDPGVN